MQLCINDNSKQFILCMITAGGGGERKGRVMRGFKNIVFITTNSHTYSQTIIYLQ